MKKLIVLATLATLSLGTYANLDEQKLTETAAQFENLRERVQAMSPEQRAEFKQMMRANVKAMSPEQRRLFKENMRQAKGDDCQHKDKHWWDKARHKMHHVFDKGDDCQHKHHAKEGEHAYNKGDHKVGGCQR